MPLNIQFAFLGNGHNYFIRVIRVSENGLPQEGECVPATYGLPKSFDSKYKKKSYSKYFLFNIRGHDFLSHCGQWTNANGKVGYLETSSTAISELAQLEPLRIDNEKNGYDGSEMIISFGPRASSFFADVTAPALKRYKSSNLPLGLEDEIQKNMSVQGYGNIYEVMINPATSSEKEDGWVILYAEGKKFAFGGALPHRLKEVLKEAKEAKKGTFLRPKDNSIHRIYLNHQNPDEYVLLFNDGRCHASLHKDFRDDLEEVVSLWATGNGLPNFAFDFISSCACPKFSQTLQNASYYSKRGMFHLAKSNVDLALKYLRAAADEDETSKDIHDNLAIAIMAMRRKRGTDEILEARINHRSVHARRHRPRRLEHQDEDTLFRDEYMWILDEGYDVDELEEKLVNLQKQKADEWSYDKAVAGVIHEVGSPVRSSTKAEGEPYELEGVELAHEMSAAQYSRETEFGIDGKEISMSAKGSEKKLRFPFRLGNRLRKGKR
ncbi:uncharacterized protein LY89DRAFT_783143 [Mollisia scopiformis]|uniref:Uncharacterized protein n=1 Tax=Mollisia scopiformis TaxID=149040 RepID=A0A194X6T8_MOLSC|nr:uncharacterized protein LY89DRAFT_783143 [Mollisia scopiformis]KUJ15891.1 hypothetical protein LY89DRAFT_783143 [Mollisia scopiformis]